MPQKAEKILSKKIMRKTVVSKSGKKFGEVGDLTFETRTGELIYVVLRNPTKYATTFDFEKDSRGNLQIPFTAVVSVGDFVIVAEEDIV
jgi:sporulation protein YlmC with PRC-barrel domain